jgi:Zn-dependent protease
MLPIPPLDGGRVLVGLLPPRLARPLAALEEKGMLIVLFLFFVLPMLGRATHMDLGFASMLIAIPYHWLLGGLAALMGFA